MSRVSFTRKAEPTIDWSEVESRLQAVSNSASSSFSSSVDLSIEPSVTQASDPATLIDRPASGPVGSINSLLEAPPLSAEHDLFDRLSSLSEGAISLLFINTSSQNPRQLVTAYV
jgi:hypothetical protein